MCSNRLRVSYIILLSGSHIFGSHFYYIIAHIPQYGETLFGIGIIDSYTRFAALRRRQSSATVGSISIQAHPIGRAKHVS
jgi:hypothetical protein